MALIPTWRAALPPPGAFTSFCGLACPPTSTQTCRWVFPQLCPKTPVLYPPPPPPHDEHTGSLSPPARPPPGVPKALGCSPALWVSRLWVAGAQPARHGVGWGTACGGDSQCPWEPGVWLEKAGSWVLEAWAQPQPAVNPLPSSSSRPQCPHISWERWS